MYNFFQQGFLADRSAHFMKPLFYHTHFNWHQQNHEQMDIPFHRDIKDLSEGNEHAMLFTSK